MEAPPREYLLTSQSFDRQKPDNSSVYDLYHPITSLILNIGSDWIIFEGLFFVFKTELLKIFVLTRRLANYPVVKL